MAPFGHARSPSWIGLLIQSPGKIFSQPPPPLQGILQSQIQVALAISPNKCHQDQTYKDDEIIGQ